MSDIQLTEIPVQIVHLNDGDALVLRVDSCSDELADWLQIVVAAAFKKANKIPPVVLVLDKCIDLAVVQVPK